MGSEEHLSIVVRSTANASFDATSMPPWKAILTCLHFSKYAPFEGSGWNARVDLSRCRTNTVQGSTFTVQAIGFPHLLVHTSGDPGCHSHSFGKLKGAPGPSNHHPNQALLHHRVQFCHKQKHSSFLLGPSWGVAWFGAPSVLGVDTEAEQWGSVFHIKNHFLTGIWAGYTSFACFHTIYLSCTFCASVSRYLTALGHGRLS